MLNDAQQDNGVRSISICGENVEVRLTGFRGGQFSDFYVKREPACAPGWFIFGRNPAYSDSYIMLVARPDVKARKHRHYNVVVRRGWMTKKAANIICSEMNRLDAKCRHMIADLGAMHGTAFEKIGLIARKDAARVTNARYAALANEGAV